MRKLAVWVLATLLLFAVRPVLADGPTGQYTPVNQYVSATYPNTATVTIPGVSGQRVRIYNVTVVCYNANSVVVPTVRVIDGTALVFATPGQTYSNITYPVGQYKWNPPLTLSVGATATILGNYGAGCGTTTDLIVQADQF